MERKIISENIFVPKKDESPERVLEGYRLKYIKESDRQLWAQIFVHKSFGPDNQQTGKTRLNFVLEYPPTGEQYQLLELLYDEQKQWPVTLTVRKRVLEEINGATYPITPPIEGYNELPIANSTLLREKLNEILSQEDGEVSKSIVELMKD